MVDIDTIRHWCWVIAERVEFEQDFEGYHWQMCNTLLELNNVICGVG